MFCTHNYAYVTYPTANSKVFGPKRYTSEPKKSERTQVIIAFARADFYLLSNGMEKWTTNEVCSFIANKGFQEDVVELFSVNRITGEVLSLLTEDDLKELGVAALGDRKLLLKALKTAQASEGKQVIESVN